MIVYHPSIEKEIARKPKKEPLNSEILAWVLAMVFFFL
jgi:hypothetical protein